MSVYKLLLQLKNIAAIAPAASDELDDMLKAVLAIVKNQFDAYLIDIMWEQWQGSQTQLRVVMLYETEKYGYDTRSLYVSESNTPSSLTGYSYENNQEIWIVDDDELQPEKEYENLWPSNAPLVKIPGNTIYPYNKQKKIKTEICIPLQLYVAKDWGGAAGALNIELTKAVYPNPDAVALLRDCVSVIEQVQGRRLAAASASRYSKYAIDDVRYMYRELDNIDEPGVVPTVFVAMPYSTGDNQLLKECIGASLSSFGITVLWPETVGEITSSIWRSINKSHFGVVVSTGYNRNVLLEWGYMLGAGKPVIRLHTDSGDRETSPFNVDSVATLNYVDGGEIMSKEKIIELVSKGVDTLKKENEAIRNVIASSKE